MFSENRLSARDLIVSTLGSEACRGVIFIKSDRAADLDAPEFFAPFPNIQGVGLGPLHRCFDVESVFGGKCVGPRRHLRALQKKFGAPTGVGPIDLYSHANKDAPIFLQQLSKLSIQAHIAAASVYDADAIVDGINPKTPLSPCDEYFQSLAAIIIKFKEYMPRENGKRALRKILICAATCENCQYCANNSRYVATLNSGEPFPLGAAEDEAERRALKARFANTYKQTKSTFELSAKFFALRRMLRSEASIAISEKRGYFQGVGLLRRVIADEPPAERWPALRQ